MSDTTITPEERAAIRKVFGGNNYDAGNTMIRMLGALEQAEARADELEEYIAKLVCELTDGKLSKPYDVSVITDEVESIYRAYSEDEIAKSTVKAEANVARLTKELDWLAKVCSVHCSDKCTDTANCSISHCLMQHCRHTTSEEWKEAARRAVADEIEVNNDRG